jgi:Ca2+-transporting ATPase
MTMAFAVVAMSAVNMGLVMRRERQAPWSSPVFPFLGWVMLGWGLTWAAVELAMFQRLLDTVPLTGGQWALVLGLSVVAPLVVAIDNAVQIRRLNESEAASDSGAPTAGIDSR